MALSGFRDRHPRLFFPADDPDGLYASTEDPHRQRILNNILADCRAFQRRRPWARIPERFDSPHPYHQLYITFYTGMQASALIEQYAFAWKMTGNEAWLRRARAWLLAAAGWEHSDRIEEHFYTANRYMHAFAVGLDLLWDQLTTKEQQRVTDCLVRLMKRWWPDVDGQRANPEGGHHAVVDNAHFGVAALHLLGKHPDAPQWVEAVVERFRCAIMPNGCGPYGEPVDGPSFWTWENLWLLQFADALRNVVGIDLYAEFPERLTRPLTWFRYQLVGPDAQGAGRREAWSPTLLRLAQEAGDEKLREVALGDPHLGRIYRFMAGVKGSSAECMIAYGPYAYLFCDPAFSHSRSRRRTPPLSTCFKARFGDAAVLRDGWEAGAMVAQVCGYEGGVAHNFSELHLHLDGQRMLETISSEEAQPVGCGSTPSVGGQNELVAHLGKLERKQRYDRLAVQSKRLHQEYWLVRDPAPALLVAVKRQRRGVKWVPSGEGGFAHLDGTDYLQYAREPHFNPSAGQVRLRVRLQERANARDLPRVLFNTGLGIGTVGGPGPQVNNYTLGLDEQGLFFRVQSQRGHSVETRLSSELPRAGRWCEVRAAWGGFNTRGAQPHIAVSLGDTTERRDDPARFGELGLDSQQLQSRSTPRDYYIKSNTVLAFGGAVQLQGTETKCDIAEVELQCPRREPLCLDFASGLGDESGSAPPLWKLNPASLGTVTRSRARLQAGAQPVDVLPVFPGRVGLTTETVPHTPSGLAAGSLRHLAPGAEEDNTRLQVAAEEGDVLVLAFAPARSKLRVERSDEGFVLRAGDRRLGFALSAASREVLIETD